MMVWKRALAIAALALCSFASAGAELPAAGDGAQKHFLWKVTGPNGRRLSARHDPCRQGRFLSAAVDHRGEL